MRHTLIGVVVVALVLLAAPHAARAQAPPAGASPIRVFVVAPSNPSGFVDEESKAQTFVANFLTTDLLERPTTRSKDKRLQAQVAAAVLIVTAPTAETADVSITLSATSGANGLRLFTAHASVGDYHKDFAALAREPLFAGVNLSMDLKHWINDNAATIRAARK